MVNLGNIGASRWVCFYSDGDGNFRPKIIVDGKKPEFTKLLTKEDRWKNDEYRIDFDKIAWLLRDIKEKKKTGEKIMKKFFSKIIIIFLIHSLFIACGDSKVIDGVEYETYGLINRDEIRNPNIKYKVIIGNVVWGIILCETIVAPVYFFGFSLHEPVEKIKEKKDGI